MNREKNVNRAVMKKDAMALVTGAPVYTDDLAPKDCLVVKVLRSPHAHALVKTCLLYTSTAFKTASSPGPPHPAYVLPSKSFGDFIPLPS